MIDDQLTFSDHIAKTAQSCRFALFNIKKIRPFLLEHASQLLVQALVLSRMDYCRGPQPPGRELLPGRRIIPTGSRESSGENVYRYDALLFIVRK